MTNRTIDAYAAGLFDGEGCVGAMQTRGAWSISCQTGMTVKAKVMLDRMAAEFGGKVKLHRPATDRWDEAWTWGIYGAPAAAFLHRVLPYLQIKQEQAELALKIEEIRLSLSVYSTDLRRKWTPEASERCATLHRRIKELNRKGPAITSRAPRGGTPVAHLVAGRWMSTQSDLFSDLGWEPFSATWPAWGSMSAGVVYELPTPALPTTEPESSSLLGTPRVTTSGMSASQTAVDAGEHRSRLEAQVALLPTPAVNDMGAGKTVEAWDEWTEKMRTKHGNGNGHGPSLAIEAQRLLPTPVADHSRGLPQPGTDFQSLPNVAVSLLPTPRAQIGEERNQTCWQRPLGEPQNLENALARLPGVPTVLRSGDGSASPDDQPLNLLSLDEPESA